MDNPQIKSASLHSHLPLLLHPYIWPFTILWPAFLAIYLSEERYETYIDGQEWTFVWVATIFSIQALLWLVTQWNVDIDAAFTTWKAKTVDSAELIRVQPVVNSGSPAICKLEREQDGDKIRTSFLFQKRRFLYDIEKNTFKPFEYALDAEEKPKLGDFQKSQGLTTEVEIETVHRHYGDNTFDIPVPGFVELWKEHAIAPFFIFQIF